MRLLELVQDGGFRVAAHARGAEFVDGPTFGENAAVDMNDFETGGLEHLLGGFLHVFGHAVFVVAEFVMETQRGDAPLVFHDGIEVDIVFVARQDFAERTHADEGALVLADFFFEGSAEAVGVRAAREHRAAAAALESVSADEFGILLGEIAEASQIEAAGSAVVERGWLAHEILGTPGDAGSHDVLAEIVTDVTAGVRQAVGIEPRLGEEEKASGFERGGSEDDNSRAHCVVLHRLVIDEVHAAGFAGLRIDRDFADDGVGAHGQVSGVHRGVDQAGWRIERGVYVATALAFAGAAAITAAAIFVVLEAVGGDAGAILGHDAAHFGEAFLQSDFRAIQLGGALKDAVGKVGEIFFDAGDAEIEIDLVVVGSDVAVADGPIFAVAVAALGLEVVIGEAEGQASPNIGFSAETASADPGVVGAGEGIFAFVDHNIFYVVCVADVAAQMLGFFEASGIGRIADGVFIEGEGVLVQRERSAIRIVVRPLHGAQFLLDREFFSSFEEEDLQAVAGEDVRGHAARSAGSDDDRVVSLGQVYFGLHHQKTLLALNSLGAVALLCGFAER